MQLFEDPSSDFHLLSKIFNVNVAESLLLLLINASTFKQYILLAL